MKLIEIQDQKTWDAFITGLAWTSFPQVWAWGEFQASRGKSVRRFFLVDASVTTLANAVQPSLAVQLVYEKRRFSGYWYAPRGPVFAPGVDPEKTMAAFLVALEKMRLAGSSLFYRFEPMLDRGAVLPSRLKRTHALNPVSTILIDLAKSEDELLKAMHEKTRYNIRLAERHGVVVREGTAKDLAVFLKLTEETASRDRFLSHSAGYLKATYEALAPNGFARLRLAEHEGKTLAANMEIVCGDTVTYLHGASSSASRNVMAPFALQWGAMRAAKAEGRQIYDLWGANPEEDSGFYYKKSWEGITRFKRGFGGMQKDLLGTYDLPVRPLLYRLAVR